MTAGRFEPDTVVAARYRIEAVLGEGGMGTVYRARRLDLPMTVALKTLRPDRADDAEFVARFLREGEALAKMRHPHVVDILDVGTHAGTPFLVMALLEGQSLAERLATHGPIAPTALVDLMLPVLAALSTAHTRGIVHRDIKPDNIVIERTPNGLEHPRLVDFGISRLDAPLDGQRLTQSDRIVGTPLYMAPEQASDSRRVEPRSDQYALGITLYECLTGASPFEANTLSALLLAAFHGNTRRLETVAPHLDPALCAIVHRAMAPEPARRFADIEVFARALLPFASPSARSHWAPAFHAAAEPERVSMDTATTDPAPPMPGPASAPSPQPLHTLAGDTTPDAPPAPAPASAPASESLDVAVTTPRRALRPPPALGRSTVVAATVAATLLSGLAFVGWQRSQSEPAPRPVMPMAVRLPAVAPSLALTPRTVLRMPEASNTPDATTPVAAPIAPPVAPPAVPVAMPAVRARTHRPQGAETAPTVVPVRTETPPEPRGQEGSNGAPIVP